MTNKEKYETLKRLKARLECDQLQVKGIAEICNPPYMCEECDLCYAQGTLGQRNKDLAIAISSLQNSIPKEWLINFIRKEGQNVPLEEALYVWEKENEKDI